MVADEEDGGDGRLREAADAPGELPLVGGTGMDGMVGIAAEEDDLHLLGDGVVNDGVEGSQEVANTGAQPGVRVKPPVVVHSQVQVGEMQQLDHLILRRL